MLRAKGRWVRRVVTTAAPTASGGVWRTGWIGATSRSVVVVAGSQCRLGVESCLIQFDVGRCGVGSVGPRSTLEADPGVTTALMTRGYRLERANQGLTAGVGNR
jgi:hypothetical protein